MNTEASTSPALLSFTEVAAQLPFNGPSERAKKAALRRLLKRANHRRHDLKRPPLRPVRIGKADFFRPDFVTELIASL